MTDDRGVTAGGPGLAGLASGLIGRASAAWADVVVLPTNWAEMATRNATLVSRVRALENHIYYVAVNRVGDETGYHYIGLSSISSFTGDFLAFADTDREAIITAPVVAHLIGRTAYREQRHRDGLF